MTIADVEQKLSDIERIKEDDEVAHSNQDDLLAEVLLAIANGAPNAADLAKTAIKVFDIPFVRWCA